jgi:AraC-like DNA-binding protein
MNPVLVNAATARWQIRKLGETGIEASRLLEGIKLENGWLDNEASLISHSDYIRLITNALNVTGDNALGLKLGQKVNLAMFGAFGYALMSSRTLKDAADVFIKYQKLPGQLTMISSEYDGSDMVVQFKPLYPLEERVLVYAIEEVLSTTYFGMNFLVNREIGLKEIRLAYPAPGHAALYVEMFGCPVRFMESGNSMRFDASYYDLPVSSADNNVYEYCTHFCDNILKGRKNSDPFIENIRNIIMTSLDRYIKIEEMAKELGLSIRSLNRRLEERGTSYKKIMNRIRTDLAMSYLENTNLSIDQIADLIGFSETTAFRKAFKTWTGISPTEQRKKFPGNKQIYFNAK